ncbi:MAG: SDR family oxidoreductase [Halioglobus sp.]
MTDFYTEKLVYITGGSSGIGLALAHQLVQQGASIVLLARNVAKLEAAVEELIAGKLTTQQTVTFLSVDVTDESALAVSLDRAVADIGTPDVLITCAGMATAKPFFEHSLKDFSDNLNANVMGTVAVIHALAPHMQNAGGGTIAMLGSLGGILPVWGYSAYSTSKAALVGLAEVLRYELGPKGFNICLICPSEVNTPMIAAETETVPRPTRFIKDLVGISTPEAIAQHSLKNIAKGEALIIKGIRGKMFYHTQRLFPGLYRMTVRLLLKWPGAS